MPASGWAGNVGVPGGIPTDYSVAYNVVQPMAGYPGPPADPTGAADSSPAIEYAVTHCPDKGCIYIPAGSYRLNSSIVRKGVNRYDNVQHPFSIVIRGDGPQRTRLRFYGSSGDILALRPANGEDARTMAIAGGDARGSTSLVVDKIDSWLDRAPFWVTVNRVNSEAVAESVNGGRDPAYERNTCSQIVRITAIDRTTRTFTFVPALNEAHPSDSVTFCISPPYRCGIEDLAVENMSDNGGHNIRIVSAKECWIRNVESVRASRYHIRLEAAFGCEVRDCVIHDAWEAGGNADYGVGLYQWCSNNLVENNVAFHCRHSYVTEYGGQNNVIAYNCSKDPINENQLTTDYLMGDLIHHGGEPRWNLWEGNVAGIIKFDCVLGGSAYNTAFRNFILRSGLPPTTVACFGSDIQLWNYDANLVGNVYGVPPPLYVGPLRRWGSRQDDTSVSDPLSQTSAFLDGETDRQTGRVLWSGADHTLPKSYYLKAKPGWFGDLPWPAFGPDCANAPSVKAIPAGCRYEAMNR
jgi:hypothetical protein